ncbi:MAG TPA: histidine phosphatase family protein [Burkholderiales bacterium]|nr:histidine phosphatase family protein [Burkholderiales bacterium]
MDLILWRHAEAEDGSPDAARKLTKHGREQSRDVADWLKPRLPKRCEILVSPAVRAQETASALGLRFATSASVGTGAGAAEVIAAAGWPSHKAVLVVGHQPTLGRVAAMLLSGMEADWHFAKGAVWWLRHVDGDTRLFAVMHPKLARS